MSTLAVPSSSLEQAISVAHSIRDQVARAVVGQADIVDQVLIALFAGGHVLVEGLPGLGKTLLVRALARSFRGQSSRIQFTPDLMPSDITGHTMFDMSTGKFTTRQGPIFTNLLIADEINRAPAKTQAAMLEVMQERQVSLDGTATQLPPPFMTLATQNPFDHEGRILPDAQLDRFLLKILIGYPTQDEEVAMVSKVTKGEIGDSLDLAVVEAVATPQDVLSIQRTVAAFAIDARVIEYAVRICRATRTWQGVAIGAGPRGGLALVRAARAAALLDGRDFVTPDDVKRIALPALRHRMSLSAELELDGQSHDMVLPAILETVEAPALVSSIAVAIPREEYAQAVRRGHMRQVRTLVRPTVRLVTVLGLLFALGIAAAFVPRGPWMWLGGCLFFFLVALADATQAFRKSFLTVERMVASALAMGMPAKVRLVVRSTKSQRFVVIADHVPQALETNELPLTVDVEAGVDLALVYSVTPVERGNASFGPVEAWTQSTLGLWSLRRGYGSPQTVRVYPNFRAAARFALLAAESQSQTTGVKQRQRRGAGLEFAELREYAQGDMPRHIDWKATARRGKMTTRSFRDEQDQQVVMLLDCGRRLRARDEGQSHFDHALNASLLLAWVALRQGDRVGLATFGGRDRYLAPGRGLTFFNTLLNATYDLQTTTEASDIASALERVVERVRRRSLVIVLTNLRDDTDEELVRVMRHARERHLVVAASLREVALRTATQTPITDFDSAVRVAATHHYVDERERSHAALRASGLDCLDVEPGKLPAELVNFYLALKASGRL